MPRSRRQTSSAPSGGDRFMAMALAEGESALGTTSPNPSVGAVIVKHGKVVGQGRTQPPGGAHAEVMALRQAGARARGADLYVTLEPCNHTGRTGPCTEAILAAGIARVFYGTADLNPRVKGGGAARLRRAGVKVQAGVQREACERLHAAFFKHVTTGIPRVTLKLATTLDGRIATHIGHSQWITGPEARAWVHRQRARVDAVMVGAETALEDDPQLTARDVGAERQPLRVIVEGTAVLPRKLRVFTDQQAPTLLVTPRVDERRRQLLSKRGVEVLVCPQKPTRARVDLGALLRELGRRGVTHVLCEGGAGLGSALIFGGQIDRLELFVAPKLLGAGKDWLVGPAPRLMSQALATGPLEVEHLGPDLHIGVDLTPGRA